MLSIGVLGQGQENYYLGKVAEGVEDYYVGGGEAPGRWAGSGAATLGLAGEVSPEQLTRMLGSQHPDTGEKLRSDTLKNNPGFDLTFSAPKSVSVLWAFADDSTRAKIVQAHEESVDSTLRYLEDNAVWARRGHGGATFVKAPNLLAAGYRHRTSRAGDPQLHTHMLVSKLVRAEDGKWSTLHGPSLHKHLKTGSYLYRAELRDRLTRELGVQFGEVRNGTASIKGIEPATEAEFSRRRQEILAAQEEKGTGSAASMQVTALETRQAKDYGVDPHALETDWDRRAAEVGLTREHVAALVKGPKQVQHAGLPARKLALALTSDKAHFERKDVIQAICDQVPEGLSVREVEQAADHFLQMEHVQEIGELPWGKVYSTPELIELENELIVAARDGVDAGRCVASIDRTEAILRRMNLDVASEAAEPDPHLRKVTAQQREMVTRLTTGGEAIAAVNGVAGAGKTYALEAANRIWTGHGYPVLGATSSWQAADILSAESGIPTASIAARLAEWDRMLSRGVEPLAPETVLVVDEAGMVNTRDLAALRQHVERVGGKLTIIGDYDQLPAVGAGGSFRAIYERHGVASMPHSRRQTRAVDREIIDMIGRGQGAAALHVLRTEENVTVAPNRDERDLALVTDWWESFRQGKDCLMLAETNQAVEDLNQMARELLRQDGQLGETALQLPDGRTFAQGDQVVTRITDHTLEIRNLQQWHVVDVDRKNLSLTLSGPEEQQVTVGPDYLSRVTDRGQSAIQHGYAVTGHVAQGSTHSEVFAQAGTYSQWTRTALSRAKEEMRLYAVVGGESVNAEIGPTTQTQDWQDLARSMSRDNADTAAIDEPMRAEIEHMSEPALLNRYHQLHTADQQDQRKSSLERAISRTDRVLEEKKSELARAGDQVKPLIKEDLASIQRERQDLVGQLEQNHDPLATPELAAERSAERVLVERELTRRRQFRVTAARLNPPEYIERELGPMPEDGEAAAAWIRAVDNIEAHRQRFGITDRQRTLGHESKDPERTRSADTTAESIRDARTTIANRTQIELEPTMVTTTDRTIGIEI